MRHAPEEQVWLHPDVEIRDSSIAGRGLFAVKEIRVGERVLELGGHLVRTRELMNLLEAADAAGRYVDTIQVDTDTQLVLPDGSAVHFGNHSCDPNLWYGDELALVARRTISPDEEVTVDYATFSVLADFSMACCCGSLTCRGQVTGDDWRLDSLQERYGDHWTPAAIALIASQR